MKIHVIYDKTTPEQIQEMLEEYSVLIKVAVDIEQGILAGGGEMHYDCEQVLLENGSRQEDIWGANWYPETQHVLCEAFINIRSAQNNPSSLILDAALCQRVSEITNQRLGAA